MFCLKPKKAEGFVLMVVLGLLIFFSTIIQQGMQGFLGHARVLLAKKNRQYARELAYSFIPMAMTSLFKPIGQKDKEKQKAESEGKAKMSELGVFYYNLLTLSWQGQKIELKKEFDGIDATVEFKVVPEEGKISFNHIFDLKKNEIKEHYKPLLSCFMLQDGAQKVSLVDVLKEYFKANSKNYPVIDIFAIKLRDNLSVLGKPDQLGKKLFLSDLFTVWTEEKSLNPILFNKTMLDGMGIEDKILSMPVAQNNQDLDKQLEERRAKLKEFCSKVDKTFAQDWKKGLQTMQSSLWKSDNSAILKDQKQVETLVLNLLSAEIEPKFFSVLIKVCFKSVEFSIAAVVLREDDLAQLFKANDFEDKKKDRAKEGSDGKTVLARQNLYTIPGLKILRVYENFQ